jgi:hypothetical protein
MNYQDAKGRLRTIFAGSFPNFVPDTPITYRNGPDVTVGLDVASDAWVRFSILTGSPILPELGSRNQRNNGRIIVQIFTPKGQGDGRGTAIADAIMELWNTANTGSVILGAHELIPVGATKEDTWWQDQLSTGFTFNLYD